MLPRIDFSSADLRTTSAISACSAVNTSPQCLIDLRDTGNGRRNLGTDSGRPSPYGLFTAETAEGAEMNVGKELTNQIIGAAIEVHRALGPGLLESTYEGCLFHELFERELYIELRALR